MNIDSQQKIESFFNTKYSAFEIEAEQQSIYYIDNLKLNSLNLDQKIIKISNELKSLLDEINNSDAYKYIYLKKDIGYELFKNSIILYQTNEINLVKESLLLKAKHKQLINLYKELTNQLSVFTWDNYIASEKNVLFYDINTKPLNLDIETYNRMKADQTEKFFNALSLETTHLKNEFCKNSNTENIDNEIDLLENIYLKYDSYTTEELKDKFSQSSTFKSLLNNENFEKLKSAFNLLSNEENPDSEFTPKYLTDAIGDIKQDKLSPPTLLASSILQYSKWLSLVQVNKQEINTPPVPDYTLIFKNEYQKAQQAVSIELEQYNDKADLDQLLKELEITRKDYNSLKNKNFYASLLQNKTLESLFVDYAFNNSLDQAIKELHLTISINDRFIYFAPKIGKLDPNFYKEYAELQMISSVSQIFQIIPMISTENETIKKLIKAPIAIIEGSQKWRTPIYFTANNYSDTLTELYNKTIDKLEKQLKQTPSNHKSHYITTELSQINRTKLSAKRNKFKLVKQFKDLKSLLNIEQKELLGLTKGSKINIEKLLNSKTKEKPLSFGYKKSDPSYIRNIIQALCLKVDFLDNQTTVDDCIKILTAKDLKKETTKIYLGCNTNKFVYIVSKLKYLFKSFTPATINKSKLFYSRKTNIINAQSMYSNKDMKSSSIAIDRIFKEQQ